MTNNEVMHLMRSKGAKNDLEMGVLGYKMLDYF